jgi:uncharacterized paraquat-inducible protein A
MFNLMKIKALRVSKILMGIGLMGYLVLFLASSIHSQPVCFSLLSGIEEIHSHHHKSPCCPKHEKHDHHNEKSHPDCPVCHFNAVVAGAVLVKAVTVPSASLFLCEVVWSQNPLPISQSFSHFYPRDPPSLVS